MRKLTIILWLCLWLQFSCAVKPLITNQYVLTTFSKKHSVNKCADHSILVNTPHALAGLNTNQMLYSTEPFVLNAFIHSAWVDPPAQMLLPLIIQSLEYSGCFAAITSNNNSSHTDYRIDTELIELQQNFLSKPSRVNFVIEVTLTNVNADHLIASRLFYYKVPCVSDTPYSGVIATNQATQLFTQELTNFITQHLDSRKQSH